jgi:hypothetical protein
VERHRDPFHGLRLTLWMALDREVAVPDRLDLYPYLQLDHDVPNRVFTIWEGDMWERQGSSRATDPWTLADITTTVVTERAISILRRAAGHDVLVRAGPDQRSATGSDVVFPCMSKCFGPPPSPP